MNELRTKKVSRVPTHPGALMKEVLQEHLKLSTAEAAKRMGVTRYKLHHVLSQRASLSPEMALRFGAFAGGAAEMLLSMQTAHDLSRIRTKIAKKLLEIEQIRGQRDK